MTPENSFRGQVDAEAAGALSIGQVARNYGVSIDKLRNWDELGILTPKRIGSQRVYFKRDLRRLDLILKYMAKGYRPKDIRAGMEMSGDIRAGMGFVTTRSVSATKALQEKARTATSGEWVREPLRDKKAYNSSYRRLERALKGAKRKYIPIRTSADGKS